METNQLTEEQLKEAMCEVRKAHRLIYEYQRRMQDLTWFIKNILNFPDYKGFKKFSAPLSSRNTIYVTNWSWDWIYTYVYEYHYGELSSGEYHWILSVIQLSDTGFYEQKGKGATHTRVDTFAPAEQSDSKLIFYLSCAPNSDNCDWDTENALNYATKDGFNKIEWKPGHIQIVYTVSLSKFVSEEATMTVLDDFVKFCNDNAKTNLKVQR